MASAARLLVTVLGLAATSLAQDVDAKAKDYTQYVNVFRGTTNGGNMFPGVVPAPFSVVKLGPDLYTGSDSYSGYQPTGNITGFSMMHESGTGGAPKYGVVAQMPVSGSLDFPEVELAEPRGAPDNASVGYYASTLASGITVELAGTDHAGMFQYSFPSGAENHVVVDVGHFLPSFRGLGWSQDYLDGSIEIFPDGHYEGHGSYDGGWNRAPKWTIYFCGYFDQQAVKAYTFKGNETLLSQPAHANMSSGSQVVGGVFTFNQTEITSRVGISWISAAKARDFVNAEIPAGTTLDELVTASKAAWNSQVLSKITTTNNVSSNLQQLYSNLYGMFIIPTKKTGENPKWPANTTDVYYDDVFTLWDLHRCSLALTQLITPTSHAEQMQSLVNIWKYEGWMPDARSSNENGETQGGSNADNVLADAYVKSVQGVDWEQAYQAMKKDATVTPPNNMDPRAPDSSTREGRGALPDWLSLGYISVDHFSRSVSRGIEYSANDFSVFQLASGLHKPDAEIYLNRSRNWRNYWNPLATTQIGGQNFSGFLVPRYSNSSFETPYSPDQCGGCYWSDPYYEALPWEYLFASRNHDMAHFIAISGGPAEFVRKLETIFTFGLYSGNAQFNNTLVNPGNEPSFNSPYLFNFAGAQDRTVYHSRYINTRYYNAGTGGIPGNSDAGAMQSYQLWNMIGLYPMVGTTTFLISAPWFESMVIQLDDVLNTTTTTGNNGTRSKSRTLKITATGQPKDVNEIVYVQSLRVNGKQWNKSWVSWEDVFEEGGTMEFVMGTEVVEWATGELPPSPAS